MNENKRRLHEDRQRFYFRLTRLGYIPDEDMREEIRKMLIELGKRIDALSDELMAGDGDGNCDL